MLYIGDDTLASLSWEDCHADCFMLSLGAVTWTAFELNSDSKTVGVITY